MEEKYVVSDVHGQYKAFMKGIQELLKPGDKIFFLGDAIDRGPDAYKLLKFLLYDDTPYAVTYLRGNHECMLMEFIDNVRKLAEKRSVKLDSLNSFWELAIEPHESDYYWDSGNGGNKTLHDLKQNLTNIEELNDLYNRLSCLPYHVKVKDHGLEYYLVHGSPREKDGEDMLWVSADVISDYSSYGDYVIFGHKMTCYLKKAIGNEKMTVFFGKNRIGIDTGAAAPLHGGRVCFLRLSDLKAFYYDI